MTARVTDGVAQRNLIDWQWRRAHLPKRLRPATPLIFAASHVQWNDDGNDVGAAQHRQRRRRRDVGIWRGAQRTLLEIKDRDSDASLVYSKRGSVIDMGFSGVLAAEPWRAGSWGCRLGWDCSAAILQDPLQGGAQIADADDATMSQRPREARSGIGGVMGKDLEQRSVQNHRARWSGAPARILRTARSASFVRAWARFWWPADSESLTATIVEVSASVAGWSLHSPDAKRVDANVDVSARTWLSSGLFTV